MVEQQDSDSYWCNSLYCIILAGHDSDRSYAYPNDEYDANARSGSEQPNDYEPDAKIAANDFRRRFSSAYNLRCYLRCNNYRTHNKKRLIRSDDTGLKERGSHKERPSGHNKLKIP